jgi:hypothetical protein
MIGSHTIPVFYLQQFANLSSRGKKHGLVWVYQKGREPQERSLRVQGKQKGYFAVLRHDKSVDDEAAEAEITALENECNDVLFCAKSELFDWSSYPYRKKLAFYAGFLYSRATQRRDHSAKVGLGTYDELEKAAADNKLMQDISEAVNAAAKAQVFTADAVRESVLKLVRTGRDPKEMNTDFVSNLRWLAEYFAGLLLQKRWQVWRAPEDAEFVTSDNPVMNFIPLDHGPFHPGHGFNRPGVFTAFPLAPTACLIMGVPAGYSDSNKVDSGTVSKINEALISICDRYVYSKTRSEQTQALVQQYAGAFRYGENSLMPVGIKLPSVRGFLRQRFGLDPEDEQS